jgi:hypothetical protein
VVAETYQFRRNGAAKRAKANNGETFVLMSHGRFLFV